MIFKKILLGSTIILFSCLIVNFTRHILRLWRAGGIIEAKKEEIELLSKKNQELKESLEWVKSPEFIEKMAREKLGMAKEGERVVILSIKESEANGTTRTNKSSELKPNWRKWWEIFFY